MGARVVWIQFQSAPELTIRRVDIEICFFNDEPQGGVPFAEAVIQFTNNPG
jgi:hypothetical protein